MCATVKYSVCVCGVERACQPVQKRASVRAVVKTAELRETKELKTITQ